MLISITLLFSFVYLVLMIILRWGWMRINSVNIQNFKPKIKQEFISIIIPIRNEEKNIKNLFKCISEQNYPKEKYEVLVIDDFSTDSTLRFAEEMGQRYSLNFTVLQNNSIANNFSHKKEAIEKGVSLAKGELIIVTDADCEFGSEWLTSYNNYFTDKTHVFIAGPVKFYTEHGFWSKLLQLEFLGLVGAGGACIGMGYPLFCNAANMAFGKSKFTEIKGYEGYRNIVSGDDEFLLKKFNSKYTGELVFAKCPEMIVSTHPPDSFSAFFQQRLRWASKALIHKTLKEWCLIGFIFTYNVLLMINLLGFALDFLDLYVLLVLILIKLISEWIFFIPVLNFFEKRYLTFYLIPIQVFHVFYVIVIGIISQCIPFSWKGRKGL